MPITDNKINTVNTTIQALADRPNDLLTATNMKAKLDEFPETLRQKLNGIIDDLISTTGGDSGAENIGSSTISGVTGNTVHAQLTDLKTQLNSATTGTLPDRSITATKIKSGELTANEMSSSFLSTDGTFSSNSDTKTPTEKATKTYVDNLNILPYKWQQIATTTIGVDSASIDFNSISTNFTRLLIVGENFVSSNTTTDRIIHIRFNSDTGSNYYNNNLTQSTFYNPTVAATAIQTSTTGGYETLPKNNTGRGKTGFEIMIVENSATNYKTVVGNLYNGVPANTVSTIRANWINILSKITSISIYPNSDNILTGAKVTLYGAL